MFSEALGKLSFWFMFIGFNVTFLIQHSAGLSGMPRRVYRYSEELGVSGYNLVSTIGSFILGIGVVMVVANLLWSAKRGRRAGKRPLAGEHARVVHPIAAAAEQLRRHPESPQRRADEGHPPRGGRRHFVGGDRSSAHRTPQPLTAQEPTRSAVAPAVIGRVDRTLVSTQSSSSW
jgi:heme/copper-type cytochrome/quinol oxidase subunit 1